MPQDDYWDGLYPTERELLAAARLERYAQVRGYISLTEFHCGEIFHFTWKRGNPQRVIAQICDYECDPDFPDIT